jgi:hypothetical protein
MVRMNNGSWWGGLFYFPRYPQPVISPLSPLLFPGNDRVTLGTLGIFGLAYLTVLLYHFHRGCQGKI